jgi:uncharacterized membrane protein YsdA (DUF1294 family)
MRYATLLAFAVLYAFATIQWKLPMAIGAIYLAASATCFVAYAIDKSAARAGRWRTPERTLLLLGLMCGWPGAMLAQQWLRHKSIKPAFGARFWATVAINAGAFAWLASVSAR